MKRLFILLSLMLASFAHAETQVTHPLRGVTFERQSLGNGTYAATKTEHYDSGSVKLPAWPSAEPDRGYLAYIMSTDRPANTGTMWATWTFTSRGLFTSNPDAHVAFISRSLSTGLSNIGQGLIVGGLDKLTQSAGGACQGGTRSQPETWHENADGTADNRLFGGAFCGPVLLDWRPYRVAIHSAAGGYSYSIFDGVTNTLVFSTYVNNANSPSLVKIQKATGFTVGIVFADTPGTSWQFEISDLQMGWF
jgi:hypothetical protein